MKEKSKELTSFLKSVSSLTRYLEKTRLNNILAQLSNFFSPVLTCVEHILSDWPVSRRPASEVEQDSPSDDSKNQTGILERPLACWTLGLVGSSRLCWMGFPSLMSERFGLPQFLKIRCKIYFFKLI